jgi:curved DNA-binding protein CbpA
MDVSKDYYAILGILPSAEILVIKAAYKAMLKVYHPDKFEGTKEEAHLKTVDINEAYRILSSKDTKDEYDKLRAENSNDNFSYEEENEFSNEQQNSASHTLNKDWIVATKYKPSLINLEKNLSKISARLAFTFRVEILENKAFQHAKKLANQLENDYLKTYFGTNNDVINFAKRLIRDGYKEAAHELNQAVKVFGKTIETDRVIYNIKSEFKLYEESFEQKKRARSEQERARSEQEKKVKAWAERESYSPYL